MEQRNEFRVSADQIECLKQLALKNKLFEDLSFRKDSSGHSVVVLSPSKAEQLRDHLTQLLAAFGFDENYVPNAEGRMLESLIDAFFVS
jgi:hypothetical protein